MIDFRCALQPGSEGWCEQLSHTIEQAVDADSIVELQENEPRWHLGASIIGHECSRKIWYSFRWVKLVRYTAQMNRLFRRGHMEEPKFIHRLRRVGIECVDRDPETGKQLRIANPDNLHFGGSLDAAAHVTWLPEPYGRMLGEFKTHSQNSYDKLIKDGVRKSKPEHHTQMSIYGKRMNYSVGLYAAVNKNTDHLRFAIIPLDWKLAELSERKANRIINSRTAPARTSEHPEHQACKQCDFAGICHRKEPIEQNCRSCKHCVALPNGEFGCEGWQRELPRDVVPVGCQHWYPVA